jgi:hypothetical protein
MLGVVEARMEPAAAISFAADGAAAASGAFNAAWLLRLAATSSSARRARSTASFALAVLNAGVALQAVYAQALYSTRRFGYGADALFEPGPWLASRLLLLVGVLLISALIIRRRT